MTDSMPIIDLSIRHVEHKVIHAMVAHYQEIGDFIALEVEKVCSSDGVKKTIENEVARCVDHELREAIRRTFKHGEGHLLIDRLVHETVGVHIKRYNEEKGETDG